MTSSFSPPPFNVANAPLVNPDAGWYPLLQDPHAQPVALVLGGNALQVEANTRLFIAAPALLDACEEAAAWLEHADYEPGMAGLLAQLQAAIEQATTAPITTDQEVVE